MLLFLGVVDSLGTSGGIDTGVYTVVGGSRTQCIPSDSRPAFTITSNLTSGSTLSTCDGWQLSIQGGTPPYKVTLVPSNSADVVNVTLGPNDSVFNYLNQLPPGSQLLGFFQRRTAASPGKPSRSLADLLVGQCSFWRWLPSSFALHPRRADASPQFVIFREDARWLDIGTRARDAQG
ncbi:hypothetical protein B0H19DRAFT_1195872 [Mycena capillaripes]|nr:hypothetical protein B0H19DRAFT_1195872 [Mycena capillaripes]